MDPFGAHPLVMPYLIHKWGGRISDIIELDVASKGHVWVFVVQAVAPLTSANPSTNASEREPPAMLRT